MLFKITHQTDLAYSDLISESVMELRMAPRQEQDQHRLSFSLAIGPPTAITSYFDWLGNIVHPFTITGFHNQIRIIATSVVETDRMRLDPASLVDRWPLDGADYDYAVYDFLQFGGPVVDSPQLRDLAASINPTPGMPLGDLARRMIDLIDRDFTYQKGVTTAASPITEVLEKRAGVCQDFTHLMIGLARALRVPARYVSGFVHPGAAGTRGFGQTHAWCELLFPSEGWIGFDPANRCVINDHFVKVATGRHFHDVPPNKGIYRGNAEEKIDVNVQTDVLEQIPPELAAERLHSLALPVYPDPSSFHRSYGTQQQEHQQQQ
jgi:transglutaminase-like putative cysteine protease